MEGPLVSVIIPVYNCEKYLEQSIRSIMNQTYNNLEILIADDCSKDNSRTILDKLAIEDNRIVIIQNEENLRIVKTLNKLIAIAKGKYIARMDGDDISHKDRIAKQVFFMENNPKVGICGTNAYIINKSDKIKGKTNLPITDLQIRKTIRYFSPFYHPTVMFSADIVKNEFYSERYNYAEDYELWNRLIIGNDIKSQNLKERLFYYRVYDEQSCSVHKLEQDCVRKKIWSHYLNLNEEELYFHSAILNGEYVNNCDCNIEVLKSMIKDTTLNKIYYSVLIRVFIFIRRNNLKGMLFSYIFSLKGVITLFRALVRKIEKKL